MQQRKRRVRQQPSHSTSLVPSPHAARQLAAAPGNKNTSTAETTAPCHPPIHPASINRPHLRQVIMNSHPPATFILLVVALAGVTPRASSSWRCSSSERSSSLIRRATVEASALSSLAVQKGQTGGGRIQVNRGIQWRPEHSAACRWQCAGGTAGGAGGAGDSGIQRDTEGKQEGLEGQKGAWL